jgi:hypothetical protein
MRHSIEIRHGRFNTNGEENRGPRVAIKDIRQCRKNTSKQLIKDLL